ncbi:MAG: hypothetical protein ACOC5T_08350 [Elusimicrobiota bacterium]
MNCEYQEYCHRTQEECPTPRNCTLYEEFVRMEGLRATKRLDEAIRENGHRTQELTEKADELVRRFGERIRRFGFR